MIELQEPLAKQVPQSCCALALPSRVASTDVVCEFGVDVCGVVT
jgi:hypothetical protein